MMLDSLRHFLLIVDHGTFTEAARRAHLSQPALTASIRRLEEDLGASVLHRGRRGASPTQAGQALVPRARAALAAIEEGRRAVREVLELDRGEVRIGAGGTACTYLLPPILASFRRDHPGIRFMLRETTPGEARAGLEAGDLDLAVVTAAEGELFFVDELVLVAAPGTDAARAPFVSFRAGSTSRALLERHFPEAEVVMELGSIAAVKGHVRSGIGIALVSKHAVRTDLKLKRLVVVKDRRTPIERPLHLLHRGIDRLPPAAAALRERMLGRRARAIDPEEV
jgi:DNA-binding transcriptional LysR family regulator